MEDLTLIRFKEIFSNFSGISSSGNLIVQEQLDFVNILICCSVWGFKCERGRALLTAHYSSQFLELLEDAEDDPSTAGGTNTSSDRVSSEKVGEVEIKFHKPTFLNSGFSNENNDPASLELQTTIYGRQFLALKRSLGIFIATTSEYFKI